MASLMPPATALDALETTINSLFINIGSVFQENSPTSSANLERAKQRIRQAMPSALSDFHAALDSLEGEIIQAKQVMRRDHALLQSRKVSLQGSELDTTQVAGESPHDIATDELSAPNGAPLAQTAVNPVLDNGRDVKQDPSGPAAAPQKQEPDFFSNANLPHTKSSDAPDTKTASGQVGEAAEAQANTAPENALGLKLPSDENKQGLLKQEVGSKAASNTGTPQPQPAKKAEGGDQGINPADFAAQLPGIELFANDSADTGDGLDLGMDQGSLNELLGNDNAAGGNATDDIFGQVDSGGDGGGDFNWDDLFDGNAGEANENEEPASNNDFGADFFNLEGS